MGWSNYIVIHDWKMLVEVSRYCSDVWLEYISKDVSDLYSLFDDMQLYTGEEIKFKDISADEMNLRYIISRKMLSLFGLVDFYFETYMFMLFLDKYKIKYELLSEFEVSERKNEFKDFKKVMRNYE